MEVGFKGFNLLVKKSFGESPPHWLWSKPFLCEPDPKMKEGQVNLWDRRELAGFIPLDLVVETSLITLFLSELGYFESSMLSTWSAFPLLHSEWALGNWIADWAILRKEWINSTKRWQTEDLISLFQGAQSGMNVPLLWWAQGKSL